MGVPMRMAPAEAKVSGSLFTGRYDEGAVIDKGCPWCGAQPDEACVTPAGKPRNDHGAREYAPIEQGSNDDA